MKAPSRDPLRRTTGKAWRQRLSFRVGIAVALLVLGVTAVQTIAFRLVLARYSLDVRQHVIEEGVALARLVARAEVDPETLQRELGPISNFAISLYDRDGRRIAMSRADVETRATLDEAARAGAAAADGAPYYLTELLPGSRTEVVATVGGVGPAAYVGIVEQTTVTTFVEGRTTMLVLITLAALLMALAVTWLLARRLRQSVKATERVVHRMAAGDLSVRLAEAGDDEVGDLVRDFNAMADQLAANVARLEGEETRQKQLFAAFTHEINTPLTAVLGYLESLQMPEVDADEATRKRYVEIAFDQARQLDALADDLTTLSRLDYDGIVLDRTPLDLARIAESEASALRPRAKERDVSIQVVGGPVVAEVDRARLGQVLRNVLDNAMRHASPGSEVRVGVEDGDPKVITITDQGPGIAEEHLAHLGAPLYRPDGARDRSSGGRGLGLAIAKGLVKAHGGELTITSRVGEGTTVRITLGSEA